MLKLENINEYWRALSRNLYHILTVSTADRALRIMQGVNEAEDFMAWKAVSYTHLTLPTICSV
eukprot:7026233-Alexandrium_andersonii.AAC.1